MKHKHPPPHNSHTFTHTPSLSHTHTFLTLFLHTNKSFIALFIYTFLIIICSPLILNGQADDVKDKMEGRKVTVNGAQLDSPVGSVQWCGNDHQTVLLRTLTNRLYKSVNGGRTWTDISEQFIIRRDDGEDIVEIQSIHINPLDKNIVVAFASKTTALVSENGAKSFKNIKKPKHIQAWMFHPKNPKWALIAGVSENCYTNIGVDDADCNRELYITKDLGKTVEFISSYVVQYNWGDLKHHQEDYIYFTRYKIQKGNQFGVVGWSADIDFHYTKDFGKTTPLLIAGGNKFVISNEYIFVAKLSDQHNQLVNMMVSTDGGKTFSQSMLSTDVQEKSYSILDVSEGAIMLHVNHGDELKGDSGNVYVSDASGKYFSLSLPGNVRTQMGECEFDKVMSLEGVYIANYKEAYDSNTSAIDAMEQIIIEDDDFETGVDKRRNPRAKGVSQERVRTVISFDKGGAWYFLTPPEKDSQNNPINCTQKHCHLNLHGITTFNQFAPFYSIENAIGIILGTGNIGSHLSYDPNEINTYMSRDGGLTWYEIHKGAYIYEIGDNGGLLVMANDMNPTNQVVFSWNEGQTWYDFDLTGDSVYVDNIVIEPNSSILEFILYGKRGDKGVVFHLDFKSLGQKYCKGIDNPDSYDSDYETWIPSDGHENGCILGKKVSYVRRKQTSECFHGKSFQVSKTKQHCACTKEDYECGMGFTRHIESLECVPENPHQFIKKCYSSSYILMDAYVKVPGDVCEGGWTPEKVPIPCPAHAPFTKGAKAVLFILFAILITMWGLTYINKNPHSKLSFRNQGFPKYQTPYVQFHRKNGADNSTYVSENKTYEPELGFIEVEQEENDDVSPSLMQYNSSPSERNLIEIDAPFTQNWNNKPTRRNISDTVPRLPPPPSSNNNFFDNKSMELK